MMSALLGGESEVNVKTLLTCLQGERGQALTLDGMGVVCYGCEVGL